MGRSVPFSKPKKSKGKWYLIAAVAAIIIAYFSLRESHEERIQSNQAKALMHAMSIRKALIRWKNADYDANGRSDFPLGELERLHSTKLINERAIELIPREVANADLRLERPKALDGYYFTLVHPEKGWRVKGQFKNILILATPERIGKTGVCTFYLHMDGKAYYTDYQLKERVPAVPNAKTLKQKIWQPFDVLEMTYN